MKISLSSILLFALVIPFVMTYSLNPEPGVTSYVLFSAIFLLLLLYFLSDLVKKDNFVLKSILLWSTIAVVLGSAFGSTIIARHKTAPIYQVHDIILQQEAAIRFLLIGKNPYEVTYFGTPLEQWNYSDKEVNPALYHFVMEPFYLLFALPFYFIGNHTIGYFDARIPLYTLFLSLLIMAYILPKEKEDKLSFVTLLAFNPAMLLYTYEGRSDMFMYAFLFGAFYLLYKQKYSFAGVLMALAFTVKQSAWPIFPLYFAYLYFKKKNIVQILPSLASFTITFISITLPFMLWNSGAFIDSTVLYLSGNGTHSYPISGYGLGMLLYQLGVIKDIHAYYPFIIWQTIIGILALVVMILYLKKYTSVKVLIILYAIFLFIYWYMSRYFNNSHLGYLSMVFITAFFWPHEEKHLKA